MEFPRNNVELEIYEKIIMGESPEARSGQGTVYRGDYYHLDYQPSRKNNFTLGCDGVELITRRTSDGYAYDFDTRRIPYNVPAPSGFFGKIFFGHSVDRRPFKERLKSAIEDQILKIKEKENHINSVKKTAERIVGCQMKIDNAVKEAVGPENIQRLIPIPKR